MIAVKDRLPKKQGYYKAKIENEGRSIVVFIYFGGRKWFFNSNRLPIKVGTVTEWEE